MRATVTDAPSAPPTGSGSGALRAQELAAAAAGRLLLASDRPIRGAAVDSRRVKPGDCFFALPGERTDGHLFLRDAVAHGAAALVVSRDLERLQLAELAALAASREERGLSVVRVADGLRALHAIAAARRDRFELLVVGVTGSLAKTSTKEAIAETLSVRRRVLRNEGNENNEIGVPLTLLRLSAEHEVAVLEMGMYVPGDISLLAGIARPSVGVVTAIRGSHLSRAGSIEAIERGKGELVEALPEDGTAVLNADDARVARLAARTRASIVRYGFDPSADVGAEEVRSRGEGGMSFVLRAHGERCRVSTPALGRHSVHNALAAAAVALAAGLDLAAVAEGLARGFSAPHRSSLVRAGEWRILDDSYNAAPDSMIAALELLGTLPGRRVAVLGEMLELGETAAEGHRRVGERAAGVVDLLLVVGAGAAGIADGAASAGLPARRIHRVGDRYEALRVLGRELRAGDVILLKASRGAALDLLVEQLERLAGERPAEPPEPAGVSDAGATATADPAGRGARARP